MGKKYNDRFKIKSLVKQKLNHDIDWAYIKNLATPTKTFILLEF